MSDQRGQAVTEYILLLVVVLSAYLILARGLDRIRLAEKIMKPITGDFAAAYKYGDPRTKGWDEGGPEWHPRATSGANNFRIFINPGVK